MGRNPNRKKKISFQARRLVREVLSGKHKTIKSAGEAAGYAHKDAYRALSKLQGTMSEILDQAGMTDGFLAENCLRPLLHATQTKLGQYKGKFRDRVRVEDNDVRLRALDIALRIKGKYAPPPAEQVSIPYSARVRCGRPIKPGVRSVRGLPKDVRDAVLQGYDLLDCVYLAEDRFTSPSTVVRTGQFEFEDGLVLPFTQYIEFGRPA